MIGDLVTTTEDFRDEMGIFLRALPDDEEGGARIKAVEEIQDLGGVGGRGAVVDREPDFRFGGVEGSDHRSPPLAIGNERGVKEQHMRNENGRQRDDEIRVGLG